MTEIWRTSWRPLPTAEDSREFAKIAIARLIVLFTIAACWMALLLGMLVLSAVHPS